MTTPLREAWVSLEYISGISWPPTPKDIPEPSHGRVFREKFRSVYVVKGVWSLLTDLLLNRFISIIVGIHEWTHSEGHRYLQRCSAYIICRNWSNMNLNPQVIVYSGEPLPHRVEMAYLNIYAQKVILFYLNDPVLQQGTKLKAWVSKMYSEFFLTLGTLPFHAWGALKKRKSVKNAHKFASIADKNS